MLLNAAVVGTFASLILNLDQHHAAYSAHMDRLLAYLRHFKVPTEVTKKV